MTRYFRSLLALCATVFLVQCGPQVATSNQASARVSGSTVTVSAAEAGKLNALRAQYGLPALRPSATLARVADAHARDMMRNGFFGHVSANGDTIVERTRAQGYGFCNVAENLARGQAGFDTVLRQWMTSPSHRSNVLHKQVTEFAVVRGTGNLWVMVMGRPGC
ncbi:MAG: CAP domain-containing protein [Roseovarius sp.]